VSGRLGTATTHDSRTVTYAHEIDGATLTGNLESVTGTEGIVSSYAYTSSALENTLAVPQTPYAHNVAKVTTGQGMVEWHSEYDIRDRVVEQRRGNRTVVFDYGTAGQTGVERTVTDQNGANPYTVSTTYQFDARGLITRVVDALGQTTDYTRVQPGEETPAQVGAIKTIEVFDVAGNRQRLVELDYHADGMPHTRTTYLDFELVAGGPEVQIDAEGRTRKETRERDQGWLTSLQVVQSDRPNETFRTEFTFYTDATGGITNIHQTRRQIDPGPPAAFHTTTLEYDTENGRLSRITLPDTHQIERTYYAWNAGAGPAAMPHETYHVDPGTGQPDPHLRVAWGYDGASNLASITDGRGVATTGDPDDFKTTIGWDKRGRVTDITNALGEVTTFWFTAPTFGAPLGDPETALPGEHLSQIKREGQGGEQRRRFHHDDEGNLREVERHDGITWVTFRELDWSSDDQLLKELMPRGPDGPDQVTSYTYDLLGRLATLTQVMGPGVDPVTTVTTLGYDVADNRVTVTEAAGSGVEAQTAFAFDGFDRLLSVTQDPTGLALRTGFTYDATGNVVGVEDPKEQVTTYTYDPLSRLTSVEQPMGQTVEYTWDDRGRLDRLTNARGNVLRHVYEDWGPLQKVEHYVDSSAPDEERTVSYDYDLVGNIFEVFDSDLDPDTMTAGVQPLYTMTYDALNRVDLTTVHYVPGNAISLESRYDAFANRDELDVTDGGVLYAHDWDYNALDQLAHATFPGPGTTLPGTPVTLDFDHYDNDDLHTITHGNGVVTTYAYYPNGPVDAITVENSSSAQLHRLDYTVSKRLNVTTIAEEVGTTALSPDWAYEYDAASRLTAALDYPSVAAAPDLPASDSFPYDDAGNRDDNPGSATPWAYNLNNEIERSADLFYEFDADGNLCKWIPTSEPAPTTCGVEDATKETRLGFDYSNRLREIFRPDDGVSGPTNPEVTYRYDPFGRRLEKTVNGVTTWFVWDGDQLLAEYDNSGDRAVRYAYARGFAPIQVAYPDGATGEDVLEVHPDHIDTPRMLTDDTGAAAWRSYPEAYGRSHIDTSIAANFNVRLPGQYYDEESEIWQPDGMGGGDFLQRTGLHYNRFRYYDPDTGRYLSADPMGQSGGTNLYQYAEANPTTFVDPLGLITDTLTAGCRAGKASACAALGLPLAAIPLASNPEGAGSVSCSTNNSNNDPADGDEASDPPAAGPTSVAPAPPNPTPEPPDKQKKGRPGNNRDQNKQVRDAANREGLTKEQRRRLGREVERESREMGENLGFREIRNIAREIKSGLK